MLNISIDIQFLSKTRILGYGTTQMRCVQPAEYLAGKGWRTGVGCIYRSLPRAKKIIIFHRTALDSQTEKYLSYAKKKGLITIYDTDDLLFTEDSDSHLASFGKQLEKSNMQISDKSKDYRDMMKQCDVVLVSTNYLKIKAEAFHSDVRLVKNGLANWFSDMANLISQRPAAAVESKVTIAYLSGSRHHDLDFSIVEDVLINILTDFPAANVLLVGKLNFSDRFSEFGNRFQHKPFMPYKDYWQVFRDIDINIAPLRTDLPFVQARSELKYMEAGIFGIPTVASPTETYTEAIRDGRNGLLVKDSDWYVALKLLLTDKERRMALGKAARADVQKNYCHEVRSREWNDLVSNIIQSYSRVSDKSTVSLSVAYLKILYLWVGRMMRIGKRKIFQGKAGTH